MGGCGGAVCTAPLVAMVRRWRPACRQVHGAVNARIMRVEHGVAGAPGGTTISAFRESHGDEESLRTRACGGVDGATRAAGSGQSASLGKMTAPQAMAHCAIAMEWAVGDTRAPRMLIGRVIGGLARKKVTGNDDPLQRNSPTAPDLRVAGERELGDRASEADSVDRAIQCRRTGRVHDASPQLLRTDVAGRVGRADVQARGSPPAPVRGR